MDRTEKVELTVAVMVTDAEGRLLVLDRRDAQWGGLYFPGGHIEPGESAVQAAVREVHEETGISIEHPVLCGMKQFPGEYGRYIVLFFRTGRFFGQIRDSREGHVFWVRRNELKDHRLTEQFAETIEMLESEKHSEMFWTRENGGLKMELF